MGSIGGSIKRRHGFCVQPVPMETYSEVLHLYRRAGFGLRYQEWQRLGKLSRRERVARLLKQGREEAPMYLGDDWPTAERRGNLTEEQRKALREVLNQKKRALNTAWLDRMANHSQFFVEKMTLFWHGHFACRDARPDFLLSLHNTLRFHALGNFGDLAKAVTREAAMLNFLNNQQNRKQSPNENFARELMELFTLGRDQYTEEDIQEAARAFTGWKLNFSGDFTVNERQHDDGLKQFRGAEGPWDGDDIIDLILEDRQCARFIAGKLFRFFVSETPDTERIEEMAEVLYAGDYHIGKLMEHVFLADWFYDAQYRGSIIKAPVVLVSELNRQFAVEYENPQVLMVVQRLLGQMLYNPPNVAGWPGGRAWIDTATLPLRLKLPSAILNQGIIEWTDHGDMPEDAFMVRDRRPRRDRFA
ncbi:MAG TPA: DUF1800 domain-containing protein, partial [Cytophagales bacterium]|nr:DUF1800 domain-containing protein [Cytophagales bacterium]